MLLRFGKMEMPCWKNKRTSTKIYCKICPYTDMFFSNSYNIKEISNG